MGNCEDGLISKLFLDNLLNQGISFEINTSSGLVDQDDSLGVEEGPCDVEELLLSSTQVVTAFSDHG